MLQCAFVLVPCEGCQRFLLTMCFCSVEIDSQTLTCLLSMSMHGQPESFKLVRICLKQLSLLFISSWALHAHKSLCKRNVVKSFIAQCGFFYLLQILWIKKIFFLLLSTQCKVCGVTTELKSDFEIPIATKRTKLVSKEISAVCIKSCCVCPVVIYVFWLYNVINIFYLIILMQCVIRWTISEA